MDKASSTSKVLLVLTVPIRREPRNSVDDAATASRTEGARRFDQMKCPYCGQRIGIATVDLSRHAYLLRALCEKCGKEFLIVNGIPMTEEQYSSHMRSRT